MIYFSLGLGAFLLVLGIIVISKMYGKATAELKASNNNAEDLKADAKIDEHYKHTDIDTARKRMRDKVHNHNS